MSLMYIGLGSNVGDRKNHLEKAAKALSSLSEKPIRLAPMYESSALLPPEAPLEWDRPYLNSVAEIECSKEPTEVLKVLRKIEDEQGRVREARWSPRTLDLDILYVENKTDVGPFLVLPHPEILNRHFVLSPLRDLNPLLKIQNQSLTALEACRKLPSHLPSLMAIVNLTPDSFSDGGSFDTEAGLAHYLEQIENEVHYLDLGAESTRPGATLLSPKEEIARLKPALQLIESRYKNYFFKPQISIDTRQGEVAEWALANGADLINDVSGLTCPLMKALLKREKFNYVLMHSISVPADPKQTLDATKPTLPQLKTWFSQKLEELGSLGVDKRRVILDPGVGFGKTARQSLEIMQHFRELWMFECPVLIGHSRKSFLSTVTSASAKDRDFESTGVSVKLVDRGAEILRVHNPLAHKRACLAAGLLDR